MYLHIVPKYKVHFTRKYCDKKHAIGYLNWPQQLERINTNKNMKYKSKDPTFSRKTNWKDRKGSK